MFDHDDAVVVGLSPGEGEPAEETFDELSDELSYRLTEAELAVPRVEPDRQLLPDDLDEIPPGPYLAAILSGVDRSRLNGHDLVRLLGAEEQMVSHLQAASLATTAEIAFSPPGDSDSAVERDPEMIEFADLEVAAALHLTRAAAENHIGFALLLREQYPRVLEALHRGVIDIRRARVITDGVSGVGADTAREVVDGVLEVAGDLTTGQLRAEIRRTCLEVDPEAAEDRYQEALRDQRVIHEPTPEGTAHIHGLHLPPHLAGAAMRRINRFAKQLKATGDPRPIDQIRAAVFLDLLNGRHLPDHNGKGTVGRGMVDITVDLETLAGLNDAPGELAGYGPVVADIARHITESQPEAEWRYTVTCRHHQIIHTGTTSRRPTTTMKRQVQARYRTCVFPGCRMPAVECDLDHRVRVEDGGPTTPCNLTPLCRYHHRAKDQGGWDYKPTPTGEIIWTSPLGHTYITNGQSP